MQKDISEKVSTPKNPLKHLVFFLRVMGVIYALLAFLFFFFPSEFFYLVNVGPKVFKITETIPDSSEKFWLVQGTSMLAMLSALSFLGAESPKTRGYLLVHLLSKTVSSVGFLYLFLNDHRYFAYLVGFIPDSLLGLVLCWFIFSTFWKKNLAG